VRDAARGLQWDKHADVYKAIFIAGNEPFTQGPVDFREAVAEAAAKGIVINTIFCGGRQQGVAMQWKAGADAGGGDYAHIDQAAQAGLETVRVIHGRGTGALREAIREELARHPLVTGSESAGPAEGGDGATLDNWKEEDAPSTRIFIQSEAGPWELSATELDARFLRTVTNEGGLAGRYLPSFTLTGSSDALLLGLPARRYTYTAESRSKPIRGESVYASRGQRVYHVTIYAAPGTFERDRAVFDRIVRSLAFRGEEASSSSLVLRTPQFLSQLEQGRG